jgi:glucokinase
VVIGGGLSGAYPLFLPKLVEELNGHFDTISGKSLERMEINAFNIEDPVQSLSFYSSSSIGIRVPMSEKNVIYDPVKKTGAGITRLGTSEAVSIGAYAFALARLDKNIL